jgi:hypothetical protein
MGGPDGPSGYWLGVIDADERTVGVLVCRSVADLRRLAQSEPTAVAVTVTSRTRDLAVILWAQAGEAARAHEAEHVMCALLPGASEEARATMVGRLTAALADCQRAAAATWAHHST